MTKKLRNPLSFLLIFSMLCSMCCITAFAQDDTSMEPADTLDVVADFCDSAQDAANTILDAEAPPAEPDEPSTPPEPPAEEIPSAAPEQKPTAQPEETPAAPTEENTPAAPEQNTSPEADSTPEDESPAEPLPEVPALPDGEPETTIPLPEVDTSEPAAVPETPEILVPDSIELPAETVSNSAPVPELVMPEGMNSLPTPESVQAFLDAVDALVQFGTPTEDNAEEFMALGQAAMDAYEAVQDEGLESYNGVEDALMVLMSISESVTGGAETTAIHAQEIGAGTITKKVNDTGLYQRLPRLTNLCPRCKGIVREFIPDTYTSIRYDLSLDTILKNCTFHNDYSDLGSWSGLDSYHDMPCLEFDYDAARPGTTNVHLYFEYSFDAPYEGGYIYIWGNLYPKYTCEFCGQGLECPADNTVYYDNVYFTVNVVADYVLNYDTQGGSSVASTTSTVAKTSETLTVTREQPTREGYKFLGWAEKADAKTATYTGGERITLDWVSGPTVSKTLYAVWTPEQNATYQVIREYYVNNEKTASVKSGNIEGKVGDTINGVALAADGKNSGWKYYTIDGVKHEFTYASSNPESITLEADQLLSITLRYEINTYSVVYKDGADSKVFGDETHGELKSGDNTPDFLGSTNRTGYTFMGWAPAVNPVVSAADAENGVITYTATWKANTYTITYKDGVNGSVFVDDVHPDVKYGAETPKFLGSTERTGYTFKGWIPEVAEKVIANATYVAQWEEIKKPNPPKLTDFNKVRIADEKDVPEDVKAALADKNICYGDVKIGDTAVTLLYKITVTGEKGASYTVSDEMNGKKATLISGSLTGTFAEAGSVDIYVTMTFTREEINEGKITNIATLKPDEGTDPSIPGGGTAETPAGKTYNVTINFKTDDENPEILKDPIKDTYDNGTEYSYTVESAEGIALLADNVPTNIPIRLEKDGKHYALDPVLSKNALDKLTGTIQDNDVEVDLIYSLDNVGYITKDSDTSDGIPDKYQAKVVFVAGEGGTQSGEGFYKTLTDADGKYMTSGTITIPEGIIAVPADKYKFIGWTQSDNVGEGINLDNAALSGIFQGKGGETYIFTANFAMSSIPLEPAIVRLTVNIVGNTKTVPYDGQPQSVDGFTATVTAPEGITLPENTVTVDLAEGFTAAASGTEAGNYPMNLTKEHFVVTVSDNTKYIAEIGQITDGWLKITEATTPVDPVDPTPALDVTAGNVTATYDGQPHPVSPSANKPDAQFTVTYTDAAGNTLPGAPVDASTYTATITAVLGDETDTTTATVTISPRPITITTSSASKVYDGTALTSNTYTIVNQEMVAGEAVTITVTGSQTSVGSSSNTYSITWNGTAKQTNYTITNSLGTLTVTERTTSGGGSGGGGGGGNRRPTGGSGGSTTIPENPTPLNPTAPDTKIDDEKVPLADLSDLNTADHFAYLVGYTDGTVRPTNNISRAEVATIFFRLMQDNYRLAHWTSDTTFSDVQANAWYTAAIGTDAKAGLVSGYPDGTFRPDNNITRAEFAVIAAQFLSKDYEGESLFTDISGHWAEKYINRAAHTGWIHGSGDKTFRPDDYITRAEVATLVNAMLGRTPDKDHMLDTMKQWPDNPESAWYYAAIQEATNSHLYTREEGAASESWTELQTNPDWAALQQQWAQQAAGN